VIPRLTKIIRSGITFVSRNVSNFLLPLGLSLTFFWLVGLPYVMWSAHFFVTHIQTEKISSWNGPTVHFCCFMLARASTKTFVSRVRKTAKKSSLAGSLVSRGITVYQWVKEMLLTLPKTCSLSKSNSLIRNLFHHAHITHL
jgi:hypothetical protein